jgi:hypothetical protein
MPMMPTADTLAFEFSQDLHACLGPGQKRKVVERNRAETAPRACHSHDFCDATMVVYAVFLRHRMDRASEGGMELHGALWDQAWNLAKSRDFRVEG